MTQKQIYDAVCDLADEESVSPEEYILALIKKRNDSVLEGTDGLPEEIRTRLAGAENARREAREIKRRDRDEQAMKNDIEQFREYFPGVSADMIPAEVWNEAAGGIPLAYAYALYIRVKAENDDKAAEINRYNEERSLPVDNDESESPYSKEDVEGMTPSAVRKNYKKILNSIKSWKF